MTGVLIRRGKRHKETREGCIQPPRNASGPGHHQKPGRRVCVSPAEGAGSVDQPSLGSGACPLERQRAVWTSQAWDLGHVPWRESRQCGPAKPGIWGVSPGETAGSVDQPSLGSGELASRTVQTIRFCCSSQFVALDDNSCRKRIQEHFRKRYWGYEVVPSWGSKGRADKAGTLPVMCGAGLYFFVCDTRQA